MSSWRNSKLGRKRDLGVLHLGLFEDPVPGMWELCLYLRPGVTLGVTSGHPKPEDPLHHHVPRIAKIKFKEDSQAFAERDAVCLAQNWLDAHLEDLIAGKVFSV